MRQQTKRQFNYSHNKGDHQFIVSMGGGSDGYTYYNEQPFFPPEISKKVFTQITEMFDWDCYKNIRKEDRVVNGWSIFIQDASYPKPDFSQKANFYCSNEEHIGEVYSKIIHILHKAKNEAVFGEREIIKNK